MRPQFPKLVTEDEADAIAEAEARKAQRAADEDEARKATVDLPPDALDRPSAPPEESPRCWWHGALAGLSYGVLMFAALPPIGLWILAVPAPLPLLWLIERGSDRPWRWGRWAALGVLPFWFIEQVWVLKVSAVGYLPMCLYLAFFTQLLVWTAGRARRRFPTIPATIILPAMWVGMDYLRGAIAFHGYPWYFVAHPLIDAPYLSWPAALLGVYAVTFLVVAVSGAAIDLRYGDSKRRRAGMIALGVAAAMVVVGAGWASAGKSLKAGTLARIAVVQTNVPQDNKIGWTREQRLADWERFEGLMRQAAAATPKPDLIVLPETMFPGWTLDVASLARDREAQLVMTDVNPPMPTTYFADQLLQVQRATGIPMLVGALGYDGFRWEPTRDGGQRIGFDAVYNSAVVVDQGQVAPKRYDKIHLTPFGEEMPYISLWPWLQDEILAIGASGMSFDLGKGKAPVVLDVRGPGDRAIRIASPICFEATMPAACRSLVFTGGVRRADVMVNLTNDGWFGGWDPGREQHLQLARWRCLELATPMVRAANTGISAMIDARGRLVKAGVDGSANPARVDGVLVVDVPGPGGTTVYARIGDVFGAVTALVGLGLLIRTFLPLRRGGSPRRA